MIGEIRDLETAEIAIRASLTGHLVFSTLHTNDAMGGISRLVDMGVEPFLVSAAVRAFLAQRLVRRLCPHCKVPREISTQDIIDLEIPRDIHGQIYSPKGCDRCRMTGFSGRLAIYEVVILTQAMQELVAHSRPLAEMKTQAFATTLWHLQFSIFEGAKEQALLEQDPIGLVIEVLKTCYDPEIPVDVWELGLIYEININKDNDVTIVMTLTSPSCPVAETLPPEIEQKLREIEGANSAKIEMTFEPTWEKSMMSEVAQLELGFM
jgi:FeS assembly SUF system protein